MTQWAVFDVYGTLLDIDSAVKHCDPDGALPSGFSALWRSKQLEYSWTRQLMGCYEDFAQLTEDALDYAIARTQCGASLREALVGSYLNLKAFPEVADVLNRLRGAGSRIAVLSNGTEAMVSLALTNAGISSFVDIVVSVDEIAVYKPDPRVYSHMLERLNANTDQLRFVSANAWDAAGALQYGLRVVRVDRSDGPQEYGLGESALRVADLRGLVAVMSE